MELRVHLLIAVLAATGTALASPVQRYALDDRPVYTVRVGPAAPTTVMFPGPVTALDGAGVSSRPEDDPSILLSHQPGARFFSVRAMRPGASGAANVIFGDRVYAFAFTAEGEPDRTVTFHEPEMVTVHPAASTGPQRLFGVLDQAREYPALATQYPALVQQIERYTPGTTSKFGPVTATIEEILRFQAEDVLVFHIRLENHGPVPLGITPAELGVRVADQVFPAALTDAPTVLPAGRAVRIVLVIAGTPEDRHGPLSLGNPFEIHLPMAQPLPPTP
jgi:hypothetical protein